MQERDEPRGEPPRSEEPGPVAPSRDRDRDPGGGARRAPRPVARARARPRGLRVDLHAGSRALAGPHAERHLARGGGDAGPPARHDRRGAVHAEGPDEASRGSRRRALLRGRRAPVRADALDDDRDRRRALLPEGGRAPRRPLRPRASRQEGAAHRDRLRARLAPRAQAGRDGARRRRDGGAPPRARRPHPEPGAPGDRAGRDRGRRALAGDVQVSSTRRRRRSRRTACSSTSRRPTTRPARRLRPA